VAPHWTLSNIITFCQSQSCAAVPLNVHTESADFLIFSDISETPCFVECRRYLVSRKLGSISPAAKSAQPGGVRRAIKHDHNEKARPDALSSKIKAIRQRVLVQVFPDQM
jgi:hypothetical protein